MLIRTHIGKRDGKMTAKAYVKAVSGGFRPSRAKQIEDQAWILIQVRLQWHCKCSYRFPCMTSVTMLECVSISSSASRSW